MSTEDNKLLVLRQFDEIWNGKLGDCPDKLYAPEYVNHDPYNPGQGTGPDGFKQRVGGYRNVLHDFDLRIERQIAEGDWVETHWSLRGIHGGELEGTAPAGKVGLRGRAAAQPYRGRQVRRRMGPVGHAGPAAADRRCPPASSVTASSGTPRTDTVLTDHSQRVAGDFRLYRWRTRDQYSWKTMPAVGASGAPGSAACDGGRTSDERRN
jgi:SnoaL-like polyketide cyclase